MFRLLEFINFFLLQIVDDWFSLLKNRFRETPDGCVAVHCVAGLGRAPVLVALALVELGLKYEDAVAMIREYVSKKFIVCRYFNLWEYSSCIKIIHFRKRRGAINSKQLAYLERYRPKSRLKIKNGQKNSCCIQ